MIGSITKYILLLGLTLTVVGSGDFAFAQREGGSVSGGADYHLDLNAWFTSPDLGKTVRGCIKVARNFGLDTATLQKMTEQTFNKWASYYIAAGAKSRSSDPKEWNQCSVGGENRKGFRIATQLELASVCTGNEDLTVYFGEEDPNILSRKAKYNLPFGFAELNNPFDMRGHQPAWSKGLIWIAKPNSVDPTFEVPTWSAYGGAALEMLLLHEMGHVFGNQHIDGTIMREDIWQVVAERTDVSKQNKKYSQFDPLYLEIDRNRYLLFVPENAFDLPFTPKVSNCEEYDDDCANRNRPVYQSVFKNLTGLDLQSPRFESHFFKNSQSIDSPETRLSLIKSLPSTLSLRADEKEIRFSFQPVSIMNNTASGKVFQEGCSRDQQFSSNQISIYGYLQNSTFNKKPIQLNINSGLGRVELIDPEVSGESSFCKFYTDIGMPCVLLALDFKQLREQIRTSR